MTIPWIRINATMDEDPELCDLVDEHGPVVLAAWIVLLCQAKRRGAGGVVKVSPKYFGRAIGVSAEEAIETLGFLESSRLIECVTLRAVTPVSNAEVKIVNWDRFQEDKTNAQRQSRFRSNSQNSDPVTLRNVSNGSNGRQDRERTPRAPSRARTREDKPGITEAGRRAFDELRERERLAADAIRFKELGLPNPNEQEDAA